MLKFTMGFQVFFIFVFFVGMKVEANPISRCMTMIDFKHQMDSFMNLSKEEQLDLVCTNMTNFFECVNNALVNQIGLNLKQLAHALKGTEEGSVVQLMANIEDLFIEICTDGTELHEDLMSNIQCNINKNVVKQCEDHAEDAYNMYEELQTETEEFDKPCVITAYQLSCLGSDIREECGDEVFNIYKKILRKIGFFKSGICSPDLIHTLKTSYLDTLNLPESRKSVYRVVLDMKKRRK